MLPLAIVGAGLVGPCLALALARAGCQCALLDTTPAERSPETDPRPIALALSSVRILNTLGVWPSVRAYAEPIRHIHVSEAGWLPKLRLHASECGVDAFGYVVKAGHIAVALRSALQEIVGGGDLVQRFSGAADLNVVAGADSAELNGLHRGQQGHDTASAKPSAAQNFALRARLIVLADNAPAALGGVAVRNQHHDYQQAALAFAPRLGRPHAGVAYERFCESGPIALLPLPQGRAGVVWSMPNAQAERLHTLDDERLCTALRDAFGGWLGDLYDPGPRALFKLGLRHTEVLNSQKRVLVLGNSAMQLHPVAGQGLNLALRDIAALLDLVELHRSTLEGTEFGSAQFCARFETARRGDRLRVRYGTDVAVRLYSNSGVAARAVRAPLLGAIALMPGAKRRFAHLAMGLGLPQSRLLRGLI